MKIFIENYHCQFQIIIVIIYIKILYIHACSFWFNPLTSIFSNDSIINEPIEINNEWFLIKRENFVDVNFNDYYQNKICLELLENELENEYFNLINLKS